MKSIIKKCGYCGMLFETIPTNADAIENDGFGNGYYWNCSCGDTLFVPATMVCPIRKLELKEEERRKKLLTRIK